MARLQRTVHDHSGEGHQQRQQAEQGIKPSLLAKLLQDQPVNARQE